MTEFFWTILLFIIHCTIDIMSFLYFKFWIWIWFLENMDQTTTGPTCFIPLQTKWMTPLVSINWYSKHYHILDAPNNYRVNLSLKINSIILLKKMSLRHPYFSANSLKSKAHLKKHTFMMHHSFFSFSFFQ